MSESVSRANRLDRAIADLLVQAPEVEAVAVVSFDGLPMASALPATMDEDRVAAMSAALLSLGERAAEGLGRGALSQVYIEGEHGTVFLVSADDEAVLVAVAAKAAKVGMMLYEVRRAAATVAEVLRTEAAPVDVPVDVPAYVPAEVPAAVVTQPPAQPVEAPVSAAPQPTYDATPAFADQAYAASAPVEASYAEAVEAVSSYVPVASEPTWPSYLNNGATGSPEPTPWS